MNSIFMLSTVERGITVPAQLPAVRLPRAPLTAKPSSQQQNEPLERRVVDVKVDVQTSSTISNGVVPAKPTTQTRKPGIIDMVGVSVVVCPLVSSVLHVCL